jgi:ABC-type maltose transport system permease subunit
MFGALRKAKADDFLLEARFLMMLYIFLLLQRFVISHTFEEDHRSWPRLQPYKDVFGERASIEFMHYLLNSLKITCLR